MIDNTSCEIRREILRISHVSGHGHIPTCFSVIELLRAVYDTIRHDPKNPQWEERDYFLLSKGHAALAHYVVLAHYGYFQMAEVDAFGAFCSLYGCHGDRFKVPGIEASTGSLGHGIGLAVGFALAQKIKKGNSRVYVLIGDGEANEGTVWEALMVASNLGLDNLTVIYDDNRSHSRGLQITNPAEKLRAFGCEVIEVDGHDVDRIKEALGQPVDKKVRAIVASTTKGYGCRTLENAQYEWHRKSPTDEQLDQLVKELNEKSI